MRNKINTSIFIVDDDTIFLKVLETQFKEQTNYKIKTFSTGEDCLKFLSQTEKPDIIFLDYYLNSTNPQAHNGIDILTKIKATDPAIQVIMLSAQESIEIAVNCLKHDAFDYIVKGEVAFIRAKNAITIILNQKALEKEVGYYKKAILITTIFVSLLLIGVAISAVFFPGFIKG